MHLALFMFELEPDKLKTVITQALAEDRGPGDLTTELTVERSLLARGHFVAKSEMVLAGWPAVVATFKSLSEDSSSRVFFREGDLVSAGALLGTVEGPAISLLGGERVALNFLQRLCGIATRTRQMVQAVKGTGVSILDTRKTTPGLRFLEKYAVRMGGGNNHRFGLYDGVLIKENHLRAAGGVEQAVRKARAKIGHLHKIEVEVCNMQELEQALAVGVEAVLLDNMSSSQVQKCVARIQGRAVVEVSGNIDLENVQDYAGPGVHFISVGALTHSVRAADISLELELQSGP